MDIISIVLLVGIIIGNIVLISLIMKLISRACRAISKIFSDRKSSKHVDDL